MSTLYVSTTGNDGTAVPNNPALPWLTIQAACVAAGSGDTVEIAAGTYDLGTDSVTAPANGGITGVGTVNIQYATDLHQTGCAIVPGATNSTITNLQGQCKASTLSTPSGSDPGTYSAFIGTANFNGAGGRPAAQPACTGAVVSNCSEVGYTDGFFVVHHLACTITFDTCTASSPWDNWAIGDLSAGHDQVVVTLTNCSVSAIGPVPAPFGGNPTHGVEVNSANVTITGGAIDVTGANPSAGVHTTSGGVAVVSVCGTTFTSAGGAVDTFAEGGDITLCTTTILGSSLNPSNFGDSVTFTATVSADSGTPTGTVTFFDGVTPLATRSLVAGVATLATSSLTVAGSPHDINATYNGATGFGISDSNHVSQVVSLASVTLTIAIINGASPPALNPSTPAVVPGAVCEFVVTVTGGPAASGTISLDLDGVAFGGSNPVLSGTADFFATIPAHALTGAVITATYSGDTGHNGGTVALSVDIGHRTFITFGYTGTVEGSGLNQTYAATDGVPIIVTAQIRGVSIIAPFNTVHSGPITGAVGVMTFREGSTILGNGTIDAATGMASLQLNLSVGVHIIQASFPEYLPTFTWAGDSAFSIAGNPTDVYEATVTVSPASGGGGPPPPHPPHPPHPVPGPKQVALACFQRIDCPGTDSPVLNLSSEAIDFPGFFSMYFGYIDPPMGSVWSASTCVGVAESTISQEDADLAAAREAMFCLTNPDTVFWNTPQSCTYVCQDGVNSGSYTTAAHSFQAPTQALADSLANSYACLQATLAAQCTGVGNNPQTCSFTCQTGQTATYQVDGNTFFAVDQASADQLANDFACLEAMLLAFADPNCGNQPPNCANPPCDNIPMFSNQRQTCSVPCPDGLEFSYTVRTGQFVAISQVLADRMAYSYACRQAQLNSVCLSALNPAAVCSGTTNVTVLITASGVTSAPTNLWELTAGAVPPGMTFNGGFQGNTITITGTPSAAGNFTFTVRVTETNGNFMQKPYQFCVTELLPASLPDAPLNTPYLQDITLNCGPTAAAWFLESGTLPPGITLDSENGALIGTPTTLGSYSFTIQAQLP